MSGIKRVALRLLAALALVVGAIPIAPPAAYALSDVTSSGTVTATNGAVVMQIQGRQTASFVLSGTFSSTLVAEVSSDGQTWEGTDLYDISARTRAANTTSTGTYVILGTAGMASARVKSSAHTSGTVTVKLRGSDSLATLDIPDVIASAPGTSAYGLVVRTLSGSGTSATEVQGTAASGSAAVGNPVQIGGIQTNGTMQTVKVDGNGYINAILGASSSVIGSVTQGASGSYVNSWGVQGAALEGTALTTAPVAAGLKDTAGAVRALKGSANGDLFVTLQASSSVIGAVTQSGTWTATAPSTGSIGGDGAFPMGAVNPSGNVVIPKAGADSSLFVTLQASDSNVGNFDLASAIPAGANTIGGVNQAASASLPWPAMLTNGSGTQQGTAAAPLRTDPTGTTAQPVTDNAGSLTVDSAQLPAALSGSGNLSVAVAEALPAGTNAIGKLSANSGVDIGDVDVTSMPADATELPAAAALADGAANPTTPTVGGVVLGYDGSAIDRIRTSAAGNLSATTQEFALMAVRPGDWTVTHLPAANAQATATKAAGGGTVRHVATSITASFVANTTAPAASIVTVALRDGTTGAGTVLWQSRMVVQAVAGDWHTIALSDLNIVGSANTAMTLEFDAAGGANTVESVTLTGYSVQ